MSEIESISFTFAYSYPIFIRQRINKNISPFRNVFIAIKREQRLVAAFPLAMLRFTWIVAWKTIASVNSHLNSNHSVIGTLSVALKLYTQRITCASFAIRKWGHSIKSSRSLHLAANQNGSTRTVWWSWLIRLGIFSNARNATTWRLSARSVWSEEYSYHKGKLFKNEN